jgi:hypothetical protein
MHAGAASILATKQSLEIVRNLILQLEGEDDRTDRAHAPFNIYFDNGRSILTYRCIVNEDELFKEVFGRCYEDNRSVLSLDKVDFDGQVVTASEASDLSMCTCSIRPGWVSGHERQVSDIDNSMDTAIAAVGMPLEIYLIASHVSLRAMHITAMEKRVDSYFSSGSRNMSYYDSILVSANGGYLEFMRGVMASIRGHPEWHMSGVTSRSRALSRRMTFAFTLGTQPLILQMMRI